MIQRILYAGKAFERLHCYQADGKCLEFHLLLLVAFDFNTILASWRAEYRVWMLFGDRGQNVRDILAKELPNSCNWTTTSHLISQKSYIVGQTFWGIQLKKSKMTDGLEI